MIKTPKGIITIENESYEPNSFQGSVDFRSGGKLDSTDWLDALTESVERKMNELYKGRCLDHEDVIVQRAVIVALGILVDALRDWRGR
jgi:hypothetical protein